LSAGDVQLPWGMLPLLIRDLIEEMLPITLE
jgi:hypothetical protein